MSLAVTGVENGKGAVPAVSTTPATAICANDGHRPEGEIRVRLPSLRTNAPSLKFVRIRCGDIVDRDSGSGPTRSVFGELGAVQSSTHRKSGRQ